MITTRQPAMAGIFYPRSAPKLLMEVRELLNNVYISDETTPKAIIVPHAGYKYSGAIAAKAYARLKTARDKINRIVLLGPCHRVAIQGLATPSNDAFATPLGSVPIDRNGIAIISNLPQVSEFDDTHTNEHSLEVHLPFLQVVLDNFTLIPLVVGNATNAQVAEVLDSLWGNNETLIVISSDLTHHLDYKTACSVDQQTSLAIENLMPDAIGKEQACGRIPMRGLLTIAKKRHMRIETLDLRNSGDTAGTKDRVVGYGAWALFESDEHNLDNSTVTLNMEAENFELRISMLIKQYGAMLLKLAAASIEHGLNRNKPVNIDVGSFPEELQSDGASFVTLYKNGKLRGCIGSTESNYPLIDDISLNAFKAAFQDPRFPSLKLPEVQFLHLSIAILSQPSPMNFKSEADLMKQIRPGLDGLIIQDEGKRALFLPSVWEQLPDPKDFITRLKLKAQLDANHWSTSFKVQRFITHEIKQSQLADPMSIWKNINC